MHSGFSCFLLVIMLWFSLLAVGQSARTQSSPKSGGDFSNNTSPDFKVPTGVILVKGAWASASDSVTPLPEGGTVTNNVFSDPYFGVTYMLPKDWTQKYTGPPPSDSGRYVLAQLRPADTFESSTRGSILITAQDMFFTHLPVSNALGLIRYEKNTLQSDYQLELAPTQVKIAARPFVFYGYWSPIAQLHWYVAATQIRCHAVEIIATSRDTDLLRSLLLDMNKMELPQEAGPTAGMGGGNVPVCIRDYARDGNVITRVDPVFTEHRFNSVPVRIIIDKEGKVKHIHFLTAFPDQAKAVTDALKQWRFKPYLLDHKPVEVETGIMFGYAPRITTSSGENSSVE